MKITAQKYFGIKQFLSFGIHTHAEIAKVYNCSVKTVQRVASTRRYAQYKEMRKTKKQASSDNVVATYTINGEDVVYSFNTDNFYYKETPMKLGDIKNDPYLKQYWRLATTMNYDTDILILTWVLIYAFALLQVLSFLI